MTSPEEFTVAFAFGSVLAMMAPFSGRQPGSTDQGIRPGAGDQALA